MTRDLEKHSTDPFGDDGLDALFAEARAEAPPPLSASFEARLMSAALATQAVAAPPVRGGFFARLKGLLTEFGGAPSLAGMGVAGLAGIWIGFAAPGPTADLVSSFWQGAASVSPSLSDWSSSTSGFQYSTGSELLSLLDTETD
ncbi:hypothetical protein [Pararhodobacter sp. CCB-MM2]|uniref:hypothetical protein n=1 Tax=Pararhodobacter sp. CCB-MM2 TaxID=1786003 RepID=UPI0008362DCA|nr:hypothetical protein [Pararhodobacter sp. CCB-MM2]